MIDQYNELPTTEGMEPCPCCGADASMWEFVTERGAQKVGMCTNGEAFGPQQDEHQGITNAGCPLYMATPGHYQPTIREAVSFWNEYAKALTALQRSNRWRRAQVLRSKEPTK